MKPAQLTCFVWLAAAIAAPSAQAAEGLLPPAPETLWPQWQTRIAVQTASLLPVAGLPGLDGSASQRHLHRGALLGDYYFAPTSLGRLGHHGGFRASGGLMVGAWGGAPLLNATAGPRLGSAMHGSGSLPAMPGADAVTITGGGGGGGGTVPYFGLGYTGETASAGLALTADVGLVAERPSAAGGVGRALLGNQGVDNALRELRLSPVLQLGVRYTF